MTTPTRRAAGVSFDGFISYSHAADDLLAPRLQSALQRFAKPWWKRRAVRIFRDESSLAANPHLWSSITEALDTSGWFVLLLSPDAASSEWVGKEIEYWVANKDPHRILPVVTDGDFSWVSGDVAGSAAPPALRGVFAEEPRWVDLRFARGEEQLDLQNPEFSNAVADVASSLWGVPKDELASEEVRQHRRTVRTAWAAGAALALLAIVAVAASIQSASNADEAERQAQAAQQNADQAAANAAIAEANAAAEAQARADANENAARADAEAATAREAEALARSRELASAAVANLETEPELATLLALQALDAAPGSDEPPVELVNAIWQVGSSNRLVGEVTTGFSGDISLSADGSRLAATVGPQTLRMYDAVSHEVLWEYTEDTVDSFAYPVIGPDGRTSVGVFDSEIEWHDFVAEPDDLPNRVVIVTPDGRHEATLEFPECAGAGNTDWSPDGRFLAVGYIDVCPRNGEPWMEIFDTATWESIVLLRPEADIWSPPSPRFDGNGRLYGLISWGYNPVYEADTFELVGVTDASGVGDVAPDGSRMYGFYTRHGNTGEGGTPFSVISYSSDTGAITDILYTGIRYPDVPFGVNATEDGRYVIVAAGGFTHLYDPLSGEEKLRLPSRPLGTVGYDGDRQLLYTPWSEGIRIWDLGVSNAGVVSTGDLGALSWVNGNSFAIGSFSGAFAQADLSSGMWQTGLFDLETGELTAAIPDSAPEAWLANGKLLVSLFEDGYDAFAIYDAATGNLRPFFECGTYTADGFCEEPGYNLAVSADGSELLAFPWTERERLAGVVHTLDLDTGAILSTREVDDDDLVAAELTASWVLGFPTARIDYRVIDRSSGELLWQDELGHFRHEISSDGRWILTRGDQEVQLVDTTTWTVRFVVGGFNNTRGSAFNADGTLLAIADVNSLRIVDIDSGLFIQQLELPGVSDVYFIDEETAVVGTNDGIFGIVSLSTDDLIDRTRANLRRSFTDQECAAYRIDPCLTLEEIRGG